MLAAIEADLLQPEIVEAAIQEAMDRLRPSDEAAARQRQHLERELATVEQTLSRFVAAIEAGGDVLTTPFLSLGSLVTSGVQKRCRVDLATSSAR